MANSSNIKNHSAQVQNAFQVYKRLFNYVRKLWFAIIIAIIAGIVYSGVDAGFVYFLKPLLNEGLFAKKPHFLKLAPLIIMGIFILRGIANFFSTYFMSYASRKVILYLRQDVFKHLQQLPAKFFDTHSSGQVLSVLLYGVDQVANASADVLTTAVHAIFLILGLIITMFCMSWKLALLFFIIAPAIVLINRVASLRIRKLSLKIQDSIGELSHCAEENLEGYKVVRSFEGQSYEIEKFNRATLINQQREMKVVIARSISVSAIQLITAMVLALTVYIATLDISASILSPGGFVSMTVAMLALLKPMKDLAFVQNKLYRGLAGAQSVFELLDEPTEVDSGQIKLSKVKGHIEFKNVFFAYQDKKHVLKNISFKINPGEIVALVGKSGSGKSTIANLLPRYYQNYLGEILLDHLSLKEYALKDLRRQFALVSQQITLFHDTIANNIAYGHFENITLKQIVAAAEAAHAIEFIEKLPKGFNSLIGENGILLSGGQRQRLAIARAILKNAPILILDEATSSLDTESERYIQVALEGLMKNCTTIIIAHRLSTIEHADKILYLEQGEIVEMGNHHSLLAKKGPYAYLHQMQFSEVNGIHEIQA